MRADETGRGPGRLARTVVSALLVVGGGAHFVLPAHYARLVPGGLGSPRAWVYGTGVVEVAAGALLANRRTRRAGGWLAATVLVVIFPANVKQALDSGGLWWARLPLQVPLVWWALRETRQCQPGPARRDRTAPSSSAGPAGTR